MSKTQDYIDRYALYAMEQMERYGIPASITLAQGLLESGRGESRLAHQENNHFGIKATRDWLDNGGGYGLYNDDKPNEKFCSYPSVRDSFEHHSRFIVDNSRYKSCLDLAVNDYRGWAEGLQKAGYATSKSYSSSLISIIESNNLQKYDQMVISSPGRYSTDYQANLPDKANQENYRGLNRDNVADSKDLAEHQSRSLTSEQEKGSIKEGSEKDFSQSGIETGKDGIDEGEDFESWMRKLVAGTDDEDQSQSNGMDPITDMVITMFTSLFAIAAMIDNKTPLEKSSEARRAVNDQEIDLMPILKNQSSNEVTAGMRNRGGDSNGIDMANVDKVQNANSSNHTYMDGQSTYPMNQPLPAGMRVEDIQSCKFKVTEQAKATIVIEDNLGRTHSYDVSAKELNNLQSTLNLPDMNTQQKTMAVVAFIGNSMVRSIDRENNQQLAASNSNTLERTNGRAQEAAIAMTNVKQETTPTVPTAKSSNPTPTIMVSTAAQLSSRNYDIAESQSLSRDGQSYKL